MEYQSRTPDARPLADISTLNSSKCPLGLGCVCRDLGMCSIPTYLWYLTPGTLLRYLLSKSMPPHVAFLDACQLITNSKGFCLQYIHVYILYNSESCELFVLLMAIFHPKDHPSKAHLYCNNRTRGRILERCPTSRHLISHPTTQRRY